MNTLIDMTILELLTSKICHDLISPIGAVNNGIEILEDMGPEAGPDVTELISFSAGQASAKLKAFRMAYGTGGADTNLKPDDVYKTLESLFAADGKIKQNWTQADLKLPEFPKAYCKILLSLFLLAVECLPKGGTISAETSQDGTTLVKTHGDNSAVKDAMADALHLKTIVEKLDARYVHAYVTGLLAKHYGYDIAVMDLPAACFSFKKIAS